MKNIGIKLKKIEVSEISNSKEQERRYTSPKRKHIINPKNLKDLQYKKFSKTIKKQKNNNLITLNEIDIIKPKPVILFTQKEENRNKKHYRGIFISTSQNYTPNKRKNLQFKLSESQSKKKEKNEKEKWIPLAKVKNNENNNSNKKNNCLTKENKNILKNNNKKNTVYNSGHNSNTLILNFKKDVPNCQKVRSVNTKKINDNVIDNNNDNNSYIISRKKNSFKGTIIDTSKKRNINKKNCLDLNNYENYTIKISKNHDLSNQKKKKPNFFIYNEINKKFFKSYIINKYSSSFVKKTKNINDELRKSNIKVFNERSIKKNNDIQLQYKTNINIRKNIQKSFINKKLINSSSKVKSTVNITGIKKTNVIKKKTHSSLMTSKNSKPKKNVKFLDKNNIQQMTEFSDSFNNNSIPLSINSIKNNLNNKFKNNMTERDDSLVENEKKQKDENEDKIIMKRIKKNLNIKKRNIERKNKTNTKEKKQSLPYTRIKSHKILITNININLFKDFNNKNNQEDNYYFINSDETRNTNLNLNIDESIIDLEKIYLLEEKISKILSKINEYNTCDEECQNFITFYFGVNFYKKELELFSKSKNQKKLSNYMKLEILCYFLCYDISFNDNFNQASILLKTIINILHDNYLILMSFILYLSSNNNYYVNNSENNRASCMWLSKIQKIINNELKINLTAQDMNENSILSLIVNSTQRINNYYAMIIDNLYKYLNENNNNNDIINPDYIFPKCLQLDVNKINCMQKNKITSFFFSQAFKLLNNYSFENMKLFFYLFLNNPKFHSNNNTSFSKDKNDTSNINLIQYYLPPIKPHFKYSLILNLDETLVYNDNGKSILRPHLFEFLDMLKDFYELIIFSFESNSFIDNVIEKIEEKNKYFDYVLYANQFTINKNGNLLKDLESLGREIKNIVVIDSKSHIDNKYKKNLILIKGFYGNKQIDINLLKILGYILQAIKKENYDDDIRLSIDKYRNNIKTYLSNNS